MGILYAMKTFGRYHFFKTEAERIEAINTLPEWEQKFVQTWEPRFGKAV